MEEIEKTLAALDFEPTVQCAVKRTLWNVEGRTLPEGLDLPERGFDCPNPSVGMYLTRLCPCWHDPRAALAAGYDIRDLVFSYGVLVRGIPMCAAHAAYFQDYLAYPFLCPGCGFHYEDLTEILQLSQDI